MLLRDVKDFIKKLSTYTEKKPIDANLIVQLNDKFSSLDKENLDEESLIFIKDIFETRGRQIIDTDLDYTKETHGINVTWIEWAKQFAKENEKVSFFNLLFPTVVDKTDPNNLQSIEEVSDKAVSDNGEIDCKSLYLGPDNDSIYSIRNFLTHLMTYPLSTYRKTSTQLFPISLMELSRFRQGAGHRFLIVDIPYNNLWDYLSKEVFPHLQHYGEIPMPVLPLLLELIKTYYELKTEQSDFSHFKKKLKQWLGCLYECSVSEVNQLYGIKINLSGKNYYFLELLIDIHEAQTFTLDEHFVAIAHWLNQYNPSYVVDHSALDFIYKRMSSGKFFSLAMFKDLLEACAKDLPPDNQMAHSMGVFLSEIESADSLKQEMIGQLAVLYALRWDKVVDTPMDYLRLKAHVNSSWIRLAQYLAGAKMLPENNYYKLLMPSIRINIVEALNCPLTDYPLSHYVLSEDRTRLISLDVCMNHYRSKGTFRYWKEQQWISLSAKEMQRIRYAAKKFSNHFQDLMSDKPVPSVSLKTIKTLRSLIDKCFYPKGLFIGEVYNANEMQEADRAILDFSEYFQSLDAQEQAALKEQVIIFRGERRTFENLWEGAVIKRECIAYFGFHLMQLVINYAPTWKFKAEIEEKLAKDLLCMREQSTHQVFNEYDWLSKEEAEKRCQLMFLSLMTHSFNMLALCGKTVEYWDCNNSVHDVARQIFDYLLPMIQKKDFSNSRFVYAQIVKSIVRPALAEKYYFFSFTSSTNLKKWLVDIEKQNVCSSKIKYYESEQWLLFFLSIEAKPDLSKCNFRPIIHELIRTCAQEKHFLDKKLRANIKVIKFISALESGQAEMLLQALTDFNHSGSDLEIHRAFRSYLVGEMNGFHQKKGASVNFFTKHEKMQKDDSRALSEEPIASIKQIIDTLKGELHKGGLSTGEITKNTAYLRSLEEPILTPREDREKNLAKGADYFANIMMY